MAKYEIEYTVTQTCSTTIEAKNEDEATKIFNLLEEIPCQDVLEEIFVIDNIEEV